MSTRLIDLIEDIETDDLPTNEFTIEDKDPMVLLGKLNEIVATLKKLNASFELAEVVAFESDEEHYNNCLRFASGLQIAWGVIISGSTNDTIEGTDFLLPFIDFNTMVGVVSRYTSLTTTERMSNAGIFSLNTTFIAAHANKNAPKYFIVIGRWK